MTICLQPPHLVYRPQPCMDLIRFYHIKGHMKSESMHLYMKCEGGKSKNTQ